MYPIDPTIVAITVTIAIANAGVERWLVIVQQVVPLMLGIVVVVVVMLMFELHLHPAREIEEDSLSTSWPYCGVGLAAS